MSRSPSIPPGSPRPCVLVIDDQMVNIQTVGTLLNSKGFDVMTALSAGQALERLTARVPDVILLDMMMPGVNGLDFCRRLQATPEWADIPVIFLSAAGEVDLISAALEAGAVDYVTKPFHQTELLSRIRTHLALKSARDQLEQTARDKAELLGLITHDFKNHLAGMILHADFLTEEAGSGGWAGMPPEFRECVGTLSRETHRMARCIRELLANEEAGRHPLRLEELDAVRAASEAAAALSPLVLAKNQTFRWQPPGSGQVTVRADAEALRQVLDNLLSNASKFSPPGGSITLRLETDPAAGSTRFIVTDSGPGFTPEDLTRVFTRYGRLSAAPTGGEITTGLGLSIVRTLVQRMEGVVEVGNTPDAGGACCAVRLPSGHAAA